MLTKRTWASLVLLSLAGQMAWAVENNWFNTFVYAKIAPNPQIVSWMVMCSAIVSTAVTIIIGALSDRWTGRWGKRKPFIFLGYVLWGIATIIFPTAAIFKPVAVAGVIVVFFDCIMSGFGSVGSDAALNAYVTDVTDTTNRGRIQGVLQVVMWLAFLITGAVAGIVVDSIGYFGFFYILGGIVLLIGLFAGGPLLQDPPVPAVEKGSRISLWKEIGQSFAVESLKKNRELIIVFITITVWGIASQIFAPYLLIYLIHFLNLSASEAGISQAAALFLGGILFSVPLGLMSDKWGRKKTGILLIVVQAVTLTLFAMFAKSMVTVIVFGGLLYIPLSGWFINYKSWTRDLFPQGQYGQFSGFVLLFSVLLPMMSGPFIGSWITTHYGIPAVIDGEPGFVPTALLFYISAAAVLLTLIPLFFTKELKATAVKKTAPVEPQAELAQGE